MAFGTSVHAAVEFFQKERMAGRSPHLEQVLKQFDADWFAQNVEPLVFADKDSQVSLREKGLELVAIYVEQAATSIPKAVEEPFEIDLLDPETGEDLELRLRGVIDLVETDGAVVDLKTAARSMPSGDVERHLQLSIYALVQFIRTGEIPALRLDMLLKTKVARLELCPTTRSLGDLAWTARLIARTAQAIAAGLFYPNPSWRCSECEYFAHCQAWRGE